MREDISPEILRELLTATVELIRLRQNNCAHLCIENAAPELFSKLLEEYDRCTFIRVSGVESPTEAT